VRAVLWRRGSLAARLESYGTADLLNPTEIT